MPATIVKTKEDEEIWEKAKEVANLIIERAKKSKSKLAQKFAKIQKDTPAYFKLVVFVFKRIKNKREKEKKK